MKVALIGASGNVGTRILHELARRGHLVTAIARDPSRIPAGEGIEARAGDAANSPALGGMLRGHDAVVSSVRFGDAEPDALIDAVKIAGIRRYVVVGGAGSLEVEPGRRLLDTPNFPPEYRGEAERGAVFLERLRREQGLDWTFLSPPMIIEAGTRTGKFRLGLDLLLKDEAGESRISYEDYAVALVDELENPANVQQRFTVAY